MAALTLFYSYAHEDESFRDQLEKHLVQLQRQGLLSTWHDRKIPPGGSFADEIDRHLETASIILLLVSPDFLASNYCYEVEMQRALERHRCGDAPVNYTSLLALGVDVANRGACGRGVPHVLPAP